MIQYCLCDVVISCDSSVFLWLHIQSAINMEFNLWIYGYYIVDILNILNEGLTLVDIVGVLVWIVLRRGGY